MDKESINELEDNAVGTLTANASFEKENKAQISFSIRLDGRIYFVPVDTIACIYLEDEAVYLLDFKGDKHIISKTLESIEKAVPSQQFYRINRQMIINRQAVKDVETYTTQRIVVHLTVPTPENVLVPRLKVKAFLNWIEKG
jgi:two-component system, LytTR family, response regulator LytT